MERKNKMNKTKKVEKDEPKKNFKVCDCGCITTHDEYDEHMKSEVNIKNMKIKSEFLKEQNKVEESKLEV